MATQTGFGIAAVVGVALVLVFLAMGGGRAAPAPVVTDPVERAVAELMQRPIQSFNETQIRVRLMRHLDASQRTNAQLRNAHRVWARRVTDMRYSDPVMARDMEAITATALALRGLRPHPDA
ncbi:hypothetical protein [Roseicyclus sp.]|uniref:hypothetical protein n=1 Tax=Roseicyclus sp. TaxID=1914329 RepID=UPI003F6B2D1F